jgi:murein L,D-transpeptidase YafK
MTIKALISTIILSLSLYATDLVHLYQTQGIQAVEKQLDSMMTTSSYWKEQLQDKNVSFGLYNSYNELLFCNKSQGHLKRFSITPEHTIKPKFNLETLIGGANGDKQYEGDLRTPVGVYNLNGRINHPDPFYGPLALVTSYPNKYDLAQDKNGSGIWIHGKPLEGPRDSFTKGCLVIDNDKLVALDKSISPHKTALVISPKSFPSTNKDTIATILSNLYQWRNYWKQSDLKPYLSFYNPHFKRSNGMSLTQFSIIKQNIFSHKIKRNINFYDINIIPYPNDENRELFYVNLTEKYDAGHVHFHGKKELYLEIINNKISILTEN